MKSYRLAALICAWLAITSMISVAQSKDEQAADVLNRAASLLTQTFEFENYFDGAAAPDPWSVSVDTTATVDRPCTITVEYERDSTYDDKVHKRIQTWHLDLSSSQPGGIRVVVANELARPKFYAIRGVDGAPPEMPAGLDEDVADEIGRLLKNAATLCRN